jgi:hypothetical protein
MNSQNMYAQVMFDFDANFADELASKCGDIVQVCLIISMFLLFLIK